MAEKHSDTGDASKMSAPEYGRSLSGFGVNMLVRDVARAVAFQREIMTAEVIRADRDFAILKHGAHQWMLHGDHTYHSNPLLALTGDGAIRGAGLELHLYGVDPDAAEARAGAAGYTILQSSRDKPHGIRECYIVDPDGYVWVAGVPLPAED